MNRDVTFKETVELFLTTTIYDIVNETEIPRINFIFKNDAYDLFNHIKDNPLILNKGWKPSIQEKDIIFLKDSINYDYPTIYIKDHIKFFTYLTLITNNIIKQYNKYNFDRISRQQLIYILKRIWLRMGPNDLNNIEEFLYKQLIFSSNDTFEEYKFDIKNAHFIDNYHDYKVTVENGLNNTWDESTKYISFKILTENISHDLPKIYYDVFNNCCYLYAIQNDKKANKNPEINKLIYKEFRGNSQPNKVYALKLFINMLKKKGFKTIKVPTLQVLNYDYHKILSNKEKEIFKKYWTSDYIKNLTQYEEEIYIENLNWYNHVVDKEDTISKIKTEDLIKIVYRIVNEDKELYITNDIDTSDTIDIKINYNIKKLTKNHS